MLKWGLVYFLLAVASGVLGVADTNAAMAALAQLQAGGLDAMQALAVVNRLVDQQAAMLGANDLFRASAWLFLLLIPVVWLARPVSGGPRHVVAAD
jgi:DHA2 family multidrug resistance protein